MKSILSSILALSFVLCLSACASVSGLTADEQTEKVLNRGMYYKK